MATESWESDDGGPPDAGPMVSDIGSRDLSGPMHLRWHSDAEIPYRAPTPTRLCADVDLSSSARCRLRAKFKLAQLYGCACVTFPETRPSPPATAPGSCRQRHHTGCILCRLERAESTAPWPRSMSQQCWPAADRRCGHWRWTQPCHGSRCASWLGQELIMCAASQGH